MTAQCTRQFTEKELFWGGVFLKHNNCSPSTTCGFYLDKMVRDSKLRPTFLENSANEGFVHKCGQYGFNWVRKDQLCIACNMKYTTHALSKMSGGEGGRDNKGRITPHICHQHYQWCYILISSAQCRCGTFGNFNFANSI